jgi:subtilisin family serine protease
MNSDFSNDQVSKPKKALTAVFVVSILLVSAIIINSIQSKTNLEAQTGFFSRILSSIFRDRLDPIKRIPKDTGTFADEQSSQGNFISQGEDGEIVFNFDDIEGIQALAIHPDESGVATVPEEQTLEDSFVVTFKAKPLATKTRELLEDRGVSLVPRDTKKEDVTQEIKNIQPELATHKSTIGAQQNGLLSKLNSQYGSPVSQGKQKVFSNGSRDITVRQLQTTLNAVTISNITEEELQDFVRATPNIERVERARTVKVDLVETRDIINTEELQNYFGANGAPLTGEGTIIAIVDTGVDYLHQDLGSCNFLVQGGCKVAYGYDFVNDDNDPMDDHGHGTHVAATAGGNGYYTQANGDVQPLPGIAPEATIYAYKVLSASGSGSNLGVIEGIEACADPNGDGDISDRVTVCSLSLGSPSGDPLDADALAADAAVDAGVIMTIAAGNAGPGSETVGSPGTSRKAITVGASCKPGDIGSDPKCTTPVASFSSRGPVHFIDENGLEQVISKPDIVSPGVNICAAQWGDWMEGKACLGDGEHIAINGTSMATPTVAGLMALLAQAHPDKTVAELKEILMATATDLGLDSYIQGQGLVNAMSALEALGIPNSILGIEGLPFYVDDLGGEKISTFSKTFVLENISDETLNLTVSQDIVNEGVTISFPETISIPSGDTLDFPITITVDHSIALSGLNLKESLQFTHEDEIVNLIITRRTPEYLIPEKKSINFGLFHESETSFSETRTITVSNRMFEQVGTYDVVVEPYDIAAVYQDNITVTPSVNQITVGPDGTTSFDVTISATSTGSNPLKKADYKTFVKLVSETETVDVEISFFRGYSFEMSYGETEPEFIIVNGESSQWIFSPNPQAESLVLKTTNPGPMSVMAVYKDGAQGFDGVTGIFEFDISLSESLGVVTYDVSKSKAEHRIENNYFGNVCSWKIGPESGEYEKSFSFTGGGKIAFEYNQVPENMDFALACADLMPSNKRVLVSQIYLTQGLNQDFSLNDDSADISARYLYAFNNREDGEEMAVGVNLCNFRNYTHPGAVKGSYSQCSYWNNDGGQIMNLSEGETGVVEVRSLHTDTPASAAAPNYPAFRLHAFNPTTNSVFYSSPEMFGTQEKLYAWSNAYSGLLSTENTSGSMYENNKINIVNDNFITLGVGPIVDTTMVKAYQNQFGFLSAFYHSFTSPYRYADGSSEKMMFKNANPVKVSYDFVRNGVPILSKVVDMELVFAPFTLGGILIPDASGSVVPTQDSTPGLGDYIISMFRMGKQHGEDQLGSFRSEVSFSISEETNDSVPPVIENIQLIANGILQNNFDPTTANELLVFANPGYGIQYHGLEDNENGAYDIQFMEDSFASLRVFAGDSENSMIEIQNITQTGEYASVPLEGLTASSERKYFEIQLEDISGNTTKYNFYIEVGTALSPLQLADETLLFCEKNPPALTLSPLNVNLESGGDFVPVSVSLTNQDSIACDPSSFGVTIATDQFDPIPGDAYTIRGTDVPPVNNLFMQTGTSLSFNTVNPGQTSLPKTLYLRADQYLPNGVYQIGSTATNFTQNKQFAVPFLVSVTGAELAPELSCGRENPTISPLGIIATHPNGSNSSTKSYQMSITNNDGEDCSNTNFRVSLFDDSSLFGTKKTNFVSNANDRFEKDFVLQPGETATSNVFYRSFGVVDEEIPLTISVQDITIMGSYHDTFTLDASFVYGTPPVENPDEEDLPGDEDTGGGENPVDEVGNPDGEVSFNHCDADFDGNGSITTEDQLLFNSSYGTTNLTYDLDGDGEVSSPDIILFLGYLGDGGCPVNPSITAEEDLYNDIADDPSITVGYDITPSISVSGIVYEYEITITNTSSVQKSNLAAYTLVPSGQIPYSEFIAASIPNIQTDTDTGALFIPSLSAGQTITVFVTVTMPN